MTEQEILDAIIVGEIEKRYGFSVVDETVNARKLAKFLAEKLQTSNHQG